MGRPRPARPTTRAFGSTALGGTPISETYTIANSGTAALTSEPSIGGTSADFNVTSPPATSVAAGSSTTFTVQFIPPTGGTRTATISFSENDATHHQSLHLRRQRRRPPPTGRSR